MTAAQQTGPIAVYGATGFTGRLVARELRRRDADFLIAGRSRERLESLSSELGGVPVAVAALDHPAGLRSLLEPCAAVIACAGPFTKYGEPVLAAATETGTHYVDTTGEQPFMQMVFDRYGEPAERAGAALVSGMGFDYAPGDMLASLTAEGLGPLDEVVVAYSVAGFEPTRGTALSALEIIGGGAIEWRDSRWQPAGSGVDGGRWDFAPPVGTQRTLRYPAGEQITVPRHVQTARVRTLLHGMMIPAQLMPLAKIAMPAFGLALRTPLSAAIAALIKRMPEGPSDEARARSRFTVSCEARAGGRSRRGSVSGHDVYGLTAATTSQAALLAAGPDFDRAGALAPAQAFDPASFLAALADVGAQLEVDVPPEPVVATQ